MKTPAPSSRSMVDLRDLTPARVGLGRAGASMPTKALLEFTLDHARARDAVHAAFDVPAVISGLGDLGLEAVDVCSRVRTGRIISGVPTSDERSIRLRESCWRAVPAARVSLRSSSAIGCRRRR